MPAPAALACLTAFGFIVCSGAIAARPGPSDAAAIEAQLKQNYLGRNVLVRGLYRGDQLDYDAQGSFIEGGVTGAWTLDGIVTLTDFKLRGDRLEIAADRAVIGFSYQHKHLYALPDKPVEIVVHLDATVPDRDRLDRILSQIFMLDTSALLRYAPDYWTPIVTDAAWARYAHNPRNPPQDLTLFAPTMASYREPIYFTDGGTRNGIEPPEPVDEPPPYYPEVARQLKKQGTVLMAVLVDRTGAIRDALLLGDPLGDGLDQSSINTVKRWRYRPAQRNGVPVSVIKPETVTFSISRH